MGGGVIEGEREDIIPYEESELEEREVEEREVEESYSRLEEADIEKASVIEAFIADQIEEHNLMVAGLGMAVFTKDDIILEVQYGYGDSSQGLKVDSDTVFGWGTTTRLLVQISAMQLYERGELDLHSDIFNYIDLDDFPGIIYPTTIYHLLNHRAGFSWAMGGWVLDYLYIPFGEATLSLGDTLREILMAEAVVQYTHPDESFLFFNDYGIALAAYIMEQITGMPFYEYVHQNIFAPLNMNNTALLPDLSDNNWVSEQRDMVRTYVALETREVRGRYQTPLYPMGGATGTILDMVKFGQGILPDENGASPLFERPETLMMLYPAPEDVQEGLFFYNGFMIFHIGNHSGRLLGHDGSSPEFVSRLVIDVDQGIGVVIAENSTFQLSLQSVGVLTECLSGSFFDELFKLIFEN
jgi:CubicO group peptidase (beta-lactamase class C family)